MCLKVPRLSFGRIFMLVAVDLPWELSWRRKNQVFSKKKELQSSPSSPGDKRQDPRGRLDPQTAANPVGAVFSYILAYDQA